MTLTEYRFWSVLLGAQAVRFSMFDATGAEYYMIKAVPAGKGYRKMREDVAELLSMAIEQGLDPGEVVVG